jgi:dTDP-4-amino-4,6-dideoxygalactose transaminase
MGTKTLYDEDWFSHNHLTALESFIAEEHACAVSTTQIAVQSCLELLGTRTALVPVIAPITLPPDSLSGVLRAGAHPLLLDIDKDTLQMDADQLREVIEILDNEGNTPIVLFNRPFGSHISAKLLDLVQDLPSIVDSRLLPHDSLTEDDLPCVFNLFDLTPICGGGAIILHKYVEQVAQLKLVRSGPMGLSGALSEPQAEMALRKLKDFETRLEHYKKVVDRFLVHEFEVQMYGPCDQPSILWLKVSNARQFAATLKSYGIEAVIGIVPLYRLEEVRRRYAEEPDYPVVDSLENKFVCVPAEEEVIRKVIEII